jgi:hypothetical protein
MEMYGDWRFAPHILNLGTRQGENNAPAPLLPVTELKTPTGYEVGWVSELVWML